MGPADLEDVIHSIRGETLESLGAADAHTTVLVGPGDDAGVYLIGDTAIVETVDFITPLVNDPFTFGEISAANSLSDIYAMGGRPVAALAIAAFPSCTYNTEVLKAILQGALKTIKRAGAVLIGGHSLDDQELKFGLSVTGTIDKNRILRAVGAQAGDVIILTKPIGIGILTTALKRSTFGDDHISEAVKWMTTLNMEASMLALKAGATACTDVTGFGLLGHAYNMVRNTQIDIIMDADAVPLLDGVVELAEEGMCPGGAYKNLKYLSDKVLFAGAVNMQQRLIMSDPQTSGGLLVALKEEQLGVFREAGAYYAAIGKVVKGSGKIAVDRKKC
ncbi:selenide, water dikinase SelD [Candidatus Magnetominusculus xianensis]|uniref:Selenophosphate synthetase n=1 Tax=Candidatus Magnetominusculus xianensis TaxID=1748249 RepID=A0ABR5SG72_9BACT|nr:selenide, water dikinase SelD [Candidatus Magnetominusculus xianensis]KWT87960.1 selenophosphate synthetase [Candidatus Magnetominusculus xianensis]